jgi:putative nucleotidyltransferase with HDIG domain
MIPSIILAQGLLQKYLKKEENLRHCQEVGLAMKALATYYKEDKELWQTIGLLHDIDIEIFGEDISKHTIVGEEILKKEEVDQNIIDIIKSHNNATGQKRSSKIEHCLYSADSLTGLIHAYVLMRPDKDIQKAEVSSILKKFKDKTFAKGVNREVISSAKETLGIELREFIEIVLKGMQEE